MPTVVIILFLGMYMCNPFIIRISFHDANLVIISDSYL